MWVVEKLAGYIYDEEKEEGSLRGTIPSEGKRK